MDTTDIELLDSLDLDNWINGEHDADLLINVDENEWYELNLAYLDMWVDIYNLPQVNHDEPIMPRVKKNYETTKIKKNVTKRKIKRTLTKSKVGSVRKYKTKSTIKATARRSEVSDYS